MLIKKNAFLSQMMGEAFLEVSLALKQTVSRNDKASLFF